MAVGFKVKHYWYQIGNGDFLHSFFSTISYHLEPNGWGSKYPYLLKDLYNGKLGYENIRKAFDEAKEIKNKLQQYKPNDVIWDIEDLSQRPPWGDRISPTITNLSNYFVTSDGRGLFDVLFIALEDAERIKTDLEIESI